MQQRQRIARAVQPWRHGTARYSSAPLSGVTHDATPDFCEDAPWPQVIFDEMSLLKYEPVSAPPMIRIRNDPVPTHLHVQCRDPGVEGSGESSEDFILGVLYTSPRFSSAGAAHDGYPDTM